MNNLRFSFDPDSGSTVVRSLGVDNLAWPINLEPCEVLGALVGAVDDCRFTLLDLLLVNVNNVFHAKASGKTVASASRY